MTMEGPRSLSIDDLMEVLRKAKMKIGGSAEVVIKCDTDWGDEAKSFLIGESDLSVVNGRLRIDTCNLSRSVEEREREAKLVARGGGNVLPFRSSKR